MKIAIAALAFLASTASATSLRGFSASDNALQVVIPGALREMSPADIKIFKEALAATYQDAHAADDVHFTVGSKTGLGRWQCSHCRRDDDAAAEEDDSLRVLVEYHYEGAGSQVRLGSESPAVHTAWEKAFCAKVANAGAANFANARDCRIVAAATAGEMEQ